MARGQGRISQRDDLLQRSSEERHLSRPAQPAPVAAFRRRLETATRLEANDSRWHERAIAEVPLFSPVHGDLRALRRLRRQVSLLYRLRRSQEHAGATRRTDALGLPPLFHSHGPALWLACGRARTDRRRHQGMVLLLLPVHRVSALFRFLSLRNRHGRNHHDGPRAARPDRLQHQLGPGACRQLFPYRQSPWSAAACFSGQPSICRRRSIGDHRTAD